ARDLIHDLLFVKRVADAHDHRAEHLAFRLLWADDQAAVLHADHLVDFYDSSFGIHGDIRHLHTADAAVGEIAFAGIGAMSCDGRCSQFGTGIFPAEAAIVIAGYANSSVCQFEIARLRVQSRCDFRKELVLSIGRRPKIGRTDAADGATAARGAVARVLVVADQQIDLIHRNAERVGDHLQNGCPRAGADILRSHFDFNRSIRMDREIGVAVMSASAPGVQGEAEPLLHRPGGLVSAGMPARLPAHQLVRNIELFRVNLRSRIEQIDVLLHEVEGIHVQLRSKVVERAHGEHARLGMVRRTPRARWSNIVDDVYVLLLLIRNLPDVWNRRRASTAHATRAPRIRFPRQQRAVFLRADLHSRASRGTAAGGLEFGLAIEHHLYRLAAGFLRELRRCDPPWIKAKLAAEAAADMVLMHVNVRGRKVDGLAELFCDAGHILSGDVHEQMIGVRPLGDAAVRLQAAVRDYRSSVIALVNHFRLLERTGWIAARLFQRNLVPLALLGFRKIRFLLVEYQMGKLLVFDFDRAHGIASCRLIDSGHGYDVSSSPEN